MFTFLLLSIGQVNIIRSTEILSEIIWAVLMLFVYMLAELLIAFNVFIVKSFR